MRSFRIVSDKAPETLRKLCVLTKLMHQKIRWNYGVLRSLRQVQKVLLSLKWNKRLKVDRIAFTLRKVKVTKCSKKWCGDFFETISTLVLPGGELNCKFEAQENSSSKVVDWNALSQLSHRIHWSLTSEWDSRVRNKVS